MNDKDEYNPEIYRPKDKTEKFNPYANDGWGEVDSSEQEKNIQGWSEIEATFDKDFSKQEREAVAENLSESDEELTVEVVKEAQDNYLELRENELKKQRNEEADLIESRDIEKYLRMIRRDGVPSEVDPTFVRRQIEDRELRKKEFLNGAEALTSDSDVIGEYGEIRKANQEEIFESTKLVDMKEHPEDSRNWSDAEKLDRANKDFIQRAEKMQDLKLDHENPSMFTRITNYIPGIEESRENAYHDEMERLAEPTLVEQEVYDDELREKVISEREAA